MCFSTLATDFGSDPRWDNPRATQIRLPGFTLDALVEFDWKVALGDNVLTEAELELLARLKSPLVQIRGQWVQVSAEEIQAALRDLLHSKQATA